jgi:serine/threonine protein kinase
MKFFGQKLKLSDKKRQFYYDVNLKSFLKVVQSDDQDLPILYETTHDLFTNKERHILFPSAVFYWPTQVAILFPRTSVDLHTYNKRNTMTKIDAAFTMVCILNALDYIHSKEYIHCDIKLENTVVCLKSHVAKIIDFEYATSNIPITANRTEKPFGTIIAPEMKKGNWNNSIDFYCAGYLFRELCEYRVNRSEFKRRAQQFTLQQNFSHIYSLMLKKNPHQRIGFTESIGIKSTPIIKAIVACDGNTKENIYKYSDEFIDTISKYREETSSEITEIDLVQ